MVIIWVRLNSKQASVTGHLIGQELVWYVQIDWLLCLVPGNFVASASSMACGGQLNITFNQDTNVVQYLPSFFPFVVMTQYYLLVNTEVLVCSQQCIYLVIMTQLPY